MPNHDFQVGDKVCMLEDPMFHGHSIKILTGEVVQRSASPRGDEFIYTIFCDKGAGIRPGVCGIFVYGSLDELRDVITKGIEAAVDDADKTVNRLFLKLDKAQRDQKRLRTLHREWLMELKEHDANSQKETTNNNNQ